MAERQPTVAALKVPHGRTRTGDIDYLTLTFAELAAEVAAWQADLTSRGVRPADRVLVMVRPGLPLISAAFALFSIGAVPVVIDPGMGLKSFLACVTRSRPRVLLGIPMARAISRVYRKTFRSVEIRVPASGSATARKSSAGFQSASKQPRQFSRKGSQRAQRSIRLIFYAFTAIFRGQNAWVTVDFTRRHARHRAQRFYGCPPCSRARRPWIPRN